MKQEQLREEITNKIIAALEQGTAPWRKPWIGGGSPINFVSKKAYRGINIALLAIHQMQYNLSSNVYATFNQWKEAGCSVKKGSKGSPIIFYSQVKSTKEDANGAKVDKTFP
jgi:antirestriction protein ArdC